MKIILELNQDQAQQLLQLADAAVRGGGLQYARQAVAIMNLLDSVATTQPATQEEP